MLHVTCLAHGLNRAAREARLQFLAVNKLISRVEKLFAKAPLRANVAKLLKLVAKFFATIETSVSKVR